MDNRYNFWVVFALLLSVPFLNAQEGKSTSKKGKGYLGVQIQDVTSKIEKRFKVPSDEGAYVAEVVEDTPAEKAGIKEDDVILSFGDRPVYDADDLTRFVQRTAPETKVNIVVWRDGIKKTVPVTVGRKKERSMAFFSRTPGGDGNFMVWSGRSSYGLELSTLNEQLGAYFGAPGNEGVLVKSVKDKSMAAASGFQAGDVITKVGKEKVTKNLEVFRELSDYEEGDKVEFEVYRKGSKKILTMDVEEDDDEELNFFFEDFGDQDGVVVAPRIRIRKFPQPDVQVHLDRHFEEGMQEVERELKETLKDVKENTIRLRKRAPLIELMGKRITI